MDTIKKLASEVEDSRIEKLVSGAFAEHVSTESISMLQKALALIPQHLSSYLDSQGFESEKELKLKSFSDKSDLIEESLQRDVNNAIVHLNAAFQAYNRMKEFSERAHGATMRQSSYLEEIQQKLDTEQLHTQLEIEELSSSRENTLSSIETRAKKIFNTLDSPKYSHLSSSFRLEIHSVLEAALSFSRESVQREDGHLQRVTEQLVDHQKKTVDRQSEFVENLQELLVRQNVEANGMGFYVESGFATMAKLQKVVKEMTETSIEAAHKKAETLKKVVTDKVENLRILGQMLRNIIDRKLPRLE